MRGILAVVGDSRSGQRCASELPTSGYPVRMAARSLHLRSHRPFAGMEVRNTRRDGDWSAAGDDLCDYLIPLVCC